MAHDNLPDAGNPSLDPLFRDIRSPGMWEYLVNYLLLGSCATLILLEMIESGAWRKLGISLLLLSFAIGNLARLDAKDRRRRLSDKDWQRLAEDPEQKIAAIKIYRLLYEVDLAKAKLAVEEYTQSKRLDPNQAAGGSV